MNNCNINPLANDISILSGSYDGKNKTVKLRRFSDPSVNFAFRTVKPQRNNVCYFPPQERRYESTFDRLVISIWQRQIGKREDDAVLTVYPNSLTTPAMTGMMNYSTTFGQKVNGGSYIHQKELHHDPDDKEGLPPGAKRMWHYHLKLNPPEDQPVKDFIFDILENHSKLDKADVNNIRFILNSLEMKDRLRNFTCEFPDDSYAVINCDGEQNFEDIIPLSTSAKYSTHSAKRLGGDG